jgi:hypothetical protein
MPTIAYTRRRYGRNTTYCWAHVKTADGSSISLGDPWPGINWPKDVVVPLALAALAQHAGNTSEFEKQSALAIAAQQRRLAREPQIVKNRNAVQK